MKKNIKIAIIIAIIILVPLGSVALLFLINNKKKEEKAEGELDTNTANEVTGSGSKFPLKQGSKGDAVRSLQTKLNSALSKASPVPPYIPTYGGKTITNLTEDGNFGPRTLAVVKWKFGTEQVTESQFNTL